MLRHTPDSLELAVIERPTQRTVWAVPTDTQAAGKVLAVWMCSLCKDESQERRGGDAKQSKVMRRRRIIERGPWEWRHGRRITLPSVSDVERPGASVANPRHDPQVLIFQRHFACA